MNAFEIIFTVVVVIAVIFAILYFVGRKLEKKQTETSKMMEQNRQTLSALIIDKKKMKMAEANFPKAAIDQSPWYVRNRKLPTVKVKIGPQIATLLCDPTVFKELPVKKMVKLTIAGAYITSYSTAKKGEKKAEAPAKKQTWLDKLKAKVQAPAAKADKKK